VKRIVWSKDMELGFFEIDLQHRILINLINILDDALSNKKEKIILQQLLDALLNWGIYHKDSEETLFNQYNYYSKKHLDEHVDFITRMTDFKEKDKNKDTALEILRFLSNHLSEHILTEDKKFVEYLNN
jgi:hemerythrin